MSADYIPIVGWRAKYGARWWVVKQDHGRSVYIERGPTRAPIDGRWVHRDCLDRVEPPEEKRHA